ncbi:hypothetical protein COLO4_19706 [Corchorus olitorius]|uniref:RNase H type-1 domain-containing protein n=1 Tax=Corchorus olitorius TaxID=93759 RepID=A0A1R3J3Y3_9ROSI|nr:hypothetical protein COLO4_19706 [Corchorus olitorius]
MVAAGFGVIARDSTGKVLGAYAGKIDTLPDSFATECKAALKAIQWAREMGFRRIVMEGDALTVIKKINENTTDFSPIGAYIADLKTSRCWFETCSFVHVGRQGNQAADRLANLGKTLVDEQVWIEEYLNC